MRRRLPLGDIPFYDGIGNRFEVVAEDRALVIWINGNHSLSFTLARLARLTIVRSG
jgi:hypothetical protein